MFGKAKNPAVLVLEDGTVFRGSAFAGNGDCTGEVVFNTGMSGYQEILTDPTNKEQILCMTYPLIGAYGINEADIESSRVHMEGFIVREYQEFPSNWRCTRTLGRFLEDPGSIGLEGSDTRALTRRIRTKGAMRGVISTRVDRIGDLQEIVRDYPGLVGRDIVKDVTCAGPYIWSNGRKQAMGPAGVKSDKPRVAVMDCGVKLNILRMLAGQGCEVMVVPARTTAGEILSLDPDECCCPTGPVTRPPAAYLVQTVRDLSAGCPSSAICWGSQILGQARLGKTEKLKFGHHGINQPVKNKMTGRVEISSQNHGFVVLKDTLPSGAQVTHINLNDGTLEGFMVRDLRAFSVQYHPRAAPDPRIQDTSSGSFLDLMRGRTEMRHRGLPEMPVGCYTRQPRGYNLQSLAGMGALPQDTPLDERPHVGRRRCRSTDEDDAEVYVGKDPRLSPACNSPFPRPGSCPCSAVSQGSYASKVLGMPPKTTSPENFPAGSMPCAQAAWQR